MNPMMNSIMRIAVAAAISAASVDGFAKVDVKPGDKCILMLEARRTPAAEAPVPRTPCPVAIGYPAGAVRSSIQRPLPQRSARDFARPVRSGASQAAVAPRPTADGSMPNA